MAEPPAKKQKVSKPIVFTTPGYQPDVRLVVFDQEFHVHSILLKLHSAYFRKFLDSPDKAPKVANIVPASAAAAAGPMPAETSRISLNGLSGPFNYHWVTEVDGDDDSSWYLTAAKSVTANTNQSTVFSGNELHEIKVFETMLSAIYLKPYVIDSCHLFLSLTKLADFYCTLPLVSRTLDIAFHISPNFIQEIPRYRCKIFTAAAKLRNKILFKESLIWVVGPWSEPADNNLDDARLKKVARGAWAEMAIKIAEIHCQLTIGIAVDCFWHGESESPVNRAMVEATQDTVNGGRIVKIPTYFRSLDQVLKANWVSIENKAYTNPDSYVSTRMAVLLQSNLVLNRDGLESGVESDLFPGYYSGVEDSAELDDVSPGVSLAGLEDHFLCAAIDDADLPWDDDETDF